MSEEIAAMLSDLAELKRLTSDVRVLRDIVEQRARALDAAHAKIAMIEADNAALLQLLDMLGRASDLASVRGVVTPAIERPHPGAALLAELDAARRVAAAAHVYLTRESKYLPIDKSSIDALGDLIEAIHTYDETITGK